MERHSQKMKQIRGQIMAVLALVSLLAEGVTAWPAIAQEMQTIEQSRSHDRNEIEVRVRDVMGVRDQTVDVSPAIVPVVQSDQGKGMVGSGPERAKRSTSKLARVSQSRAIPAVGNLSPVFGETDGYVGLSWRF